MTVIILNSKIHICISGKKSYLEGEGNLMYFIVRCRVPEWSPRRPTSATGSNFIEIGGRDTPSCLTVTPGQPEKETVYSFDVGVLSLRRKSSYESTIYCFCFVPDPRSGTVMIVRLKTPSNGHFRNTTLTSKR